MASRGACCLPVALAVALTGAGCGGSGTGSGHRHAHARRSGAGATRGRAATSQPANLAYHELYSLPASLQDPASAELGNRRFVLAGGLDAADSSSAGLIVADLHGPLSNAILPGAQHDAQAAALAGKVYIFGGADFSQYDHILSFDPTSGAVGTAGTLPSAASDVGVTEDAGTTYIVGGFDGSNWLNTIVAWRPGAAARVVAHLPVALRYAAVSAVNGSVLIVGGSTPNGASNAILRFDPASGLVRQIGRLPHPITHGGAATLGSTVYLVGGQATRSPPKA